MKNNKAFFSMKRRVAELSYRITMKFTSFPGNR
jgi:hypothetical protein